MNRRSLGTPLIAALPIGLRAATEHRRQQKGQFLLLNEKQNAAFDMEFHSREELATKFLLLEELSEDRPFNVLDLGGGNGIFVDQLLARFPKSSATIVDISSLLLAKNKPSERKRLIPLSQVHQHLGLAGEF
jgi:methylase of polypeptide subunit release factors